MTIYDIPENTSLWEVTASIQIAQCLPTPTAFRCNGEAHRLVECANIETIESAPDASLSQFNYAGAYRALEDAQEPYVGVLAQCSGLTNLKIEVPRFPKILPVPSKSIVVCPFPTKKEMLLPDTVWRAVVHFLRGYDLRVYLLGAQGQWMDCCSFSEDEILSEHSVEEKLSILAGAELVIGVPGEWLWAAMYWQKKMIYFYPDDIPLLRWFHRAHTNYGRAVYKANQIQVPVFLHQIRALLQQL